MTTFDKNTKDLVIASSLGNFPMQGGSEGITEEEAVELINSAITEYDATVQTALSGLQEDIEQNTASINTNAENISSLTEVVSGNTRSIGTNASNIQALSAKTNETAADLAALSAKTSETASDLATLSAYTETIHYELPIASSETLGGIKVGSGLTIDSSGVLSVSGGTGGDSKYVVVEALSAVTNPVEGMIAYVPDKTVQYSNVQVITLSNTEGEGFDDYVGWINFNGTSVREIFQGGGGLKFYFDYGNSGKWMRLKGDYEGQQYTQLYRTHNDSQPSIEISAPLDLQGVDFTIAVNDSHPGITTASTSNNFSLKENGGIYRYEASEWVRVSVPKVYNLSEMDTTARVALYDELLPYFTGNGQFATRFPAEEYRFLVNASDMGENYGAIPVSLSTYGSDDGNALFFIGATAGKWAEPVYGFRASLSPDGNLETGKYEVRSYEGLPIQAVNYFDDGDNRLIFNTSTSAFTYGHNIDEAQPIVNGNTIGGSVLWFCIKPWDGNWAIGVPRLMLLVTDGNGSATYYTNPSIKTKFIPTVTIDGIDYNIEYTGNYGEVSVRFKVSDNGNAANFEFIENS